MQYMLLVYDDEKAFAAAPRSELTKVMEEYGEFTQGIMKSGHFRAGAQLQATASATTLRGKGGRVATIDGPFAETKEQLGGYYLVECRDLDEALEIARRIPTLRLDGAVEVRPVVPTSQAASITTVA